MIPDKSLSIDQGAIVVMGWQSCADKGSFTRAILEALSEAYDFRLDTPFQDYPQGNPRCAVIRNRRPGGEGPL